MQDRKPRFTVIGAGHGGKAMAAYLSLNGYQVVLHSRTQGHIDTIKSRGGITLEGQEFGSGQFAQLAGVSTDTKEAIQGSDIIMVVVPAYAHADIAEAAAPYLQDGQIIILNPGHMFGALEFRKVLDDRGCKADILLAETQTFVFLSRSQGPTQAHIFHIQSSVPLAALPSKNTPAVLEATHTALPQFIDGGTVLSIGLNNIDAIFHPVICLLNAGWIESTGGDFKFFMEGVTPSVARILEVMDRERVTIASALGLRLPTAYEKLKMSYNLGGENLFDAIHNQPGYREVKAPATLQRRFVVENVPMTLVPITSLGQKYGVSVGGMDSIIRLAGLANGTNYWQRGRTFKKLGIENLGVSELVNLVT